MVKKEKEYRKKYYWANPVDARKKALDYYYAHKDLRSQKAKLYYQNNKIKICKKNNLYYQENKKKRNLYEVKRRKENLKIRLRHNLSTSIHAKLKRRISSKRSYSTPSFLSFSITELIQHIQKLFQPGMSWNNYGKWHIDHIVPDSNFNYQSVNDKEFKKCWSLNNLQPLWAIDNLKKGNKLNYIYEQTK